MMSTRETFVDWQDGKHLRWMRDCRESGDVLRLLVGALDGEGLEGADLTRFGMVVVLGACGRLRQETKKRRKPTYQHTK